jgi:hypothetical protein
LRPGLFAPTVIAFDISPSRRSAEFNNEDPGKGIALNLSPYFTSARENQLNLAIG